MHTIEDVEYTIDTFKKISGDLKAGKYKADEITTSL
jgi:hypothetical protein